MNKKRINEDFEPNNASDLIESNQAVKPSSIDNITERASQALYQGISRRNILSKIGKWALAITGVQLVSMLPVDRQVEVAKADASDCTSWYMCGIETPYVCHCCGVSFGYCPFGYPSGGSWHACCFDPTQLTYRYVQYDDCCSSSSYSCSSNCSCYKNPDASLYCSTGSLACTAVNIGGAC